MHESILPYVWMLSGSVAFALMSTLAHALGAQCDWQVIAFARSIIALACVASLACAAGVRLVILRPRVLWLRSLAGSISLVCTFFALTRLPVSDVLTLTNTFPLWIAILSWPMLGEFPSWQVWVSVASGALGVALIQQPHFAEGNWTSLLALISAVSSALAMIGLHRLQDLDIRAIVVHFSAVASLFCVGSFFLFDHSAHPEAQWNSLTLLMLLGVGATATVGQLFLTKAFAAGPPAKVSVVGLTQVVFVMAFEAFTTQEPFTAGKLIGTLLVIAPTAWLLLQRGTPHEEPERAEITSMPPVLETSS